MDLDATIKGIVEGGGGVYGVAAKDLSSGATYELRADEVFSTASVIKVPIMIELFRRVAEGSLSMDERLELVASERVGGAGLLWEFASGLQPTLHDLCVAMIVISDNMATNMLIKRMGLAQINEGIRALGMVHTRLNHRIGEADDDSSAPRELGLTTPREMRQILEALVDGQVVSPTASAAMMAILERQHDRLMIPRLLPIDYNGMTGESNPRVANKTGAVDGVRNDVGVITLADGRQWIISAFSKELTDLRWSAENLGEVTIARIARAIYDAWAP